MSKNPKNDQYSDEETKRRAEQALMGAFKTPPMHEKKAQPKARVVHASDCAIYNAPASDPGPCDCGAEPEQ